MQHQAVRGDAPGHVWPAFTAIAGNFVDGYVLWLIGPVLAQLHGPLRLDNFWMGAIGSATLAGIFFGAILFGLAADRWGRRALFRLGPWAIVVLSLAQFWVDGAAALVVLRLLLGMAIGAEYTVAPAYVIETVPAHRRGFYLSALMLAWMLGYMAAVATIFFVDVSADSWRYLLASSAIPAAIVGLMRLRAKEAPGWMERRAALSSAGALAQRGSLSRLFEPGVRGKLAVGCIFFVCQAAPSFAIYTFFPQFLAAAGVGDANAKAGITYGLLMVGTILGMWLVTRLTRRFFLLTSFAMLAMCAAALALLSGSPQGLPLLFPLIALFALIFSAAACLQSVFPSELFPTDVRASGVGLIVAVSRIGAVSSTFIFPTILAEYGVSGVMSAAALILGTGFTAMLLWAPETKAAATARPDSSN